jgi:hypothetical protein
MFLVTGFARGISSVNVLPKTQRTPAEDAYGRGLKGLWDIM